MVTLCFLTQLFFSCQFWYYSKDRNTFKSFITLNNLKNTLVILALGAISWLLSASAFWQRSFLMNHDGDLLSYVLGGFIISVIASLPVSVNGWGFESLEPLRFLASSACLKMWPFKFYFCGFFSYISLFISMFIISFHKSFHEISTPLKRSNLYPTTFNIIFQSSALFIF